MVAIEPTDRQLLGALVREARLARGLTQHQLAELIDAHETHISLLETASARAQYYPKLLSGLAEALDLDPDEVYGLAGRITPDIETALAGNPPLLRAVRKEIGL